MSARLLGVRVSPALRQLIDQAGPVTAATRALLILGAAAAGQDVRDLASTIHVLIDAGGLVPATIAALRRLLEPAIIPAITSDSRDDSRVIDPFLANLLEEDPLTSIGIEV